MLQPNYSKLWPRRTLCGHVFVTMSHLDTRIPDLMTYSCAESCCDSFDIHHDYVVLIFEHDARVKVELSNLSCNLHTVCLEMRFSRYCTSSGLGVYRQTKTFCLRYYIDVLLPANTQN